MTSEPGESSSTGWAQSLEALRSYRQRCGTADVPRRVRAYGIDLGKWVAQCRDNYWDGDLGADQIQALEDVDGWFWGHERPGSWRHTYDALKAYAQSRGTTIVVEAPANEDVDLQAWAAAQRRAYADLQLNKPQIEMLRELPGWHWDPGRNALAPRHIGRQKLRPTPWQSRTGAARDPNRRLSTRPMAPPMPRGLPRRHTSYTPHYRTPTSTRLEMGTFPRQLSKRVRKPSSGMSPRPATPHRANTVVNGYALGWWVTQKRRQYRQGTLPPEWTEALEALPGWQWAPLDHRWRQGLQALRARTDSSTATATRIRRVRSGSMITQSGIGFAPNKTHTGAEGCRRNAPRNLKHCPAGIGNTPVYRPQIAVSHTMEDRAVTNPQRGSLDIPAQPGSRCPTLKRYA